MSRTRSLSRMFLSTLTQYEVIMHDEKQKLENSSISDTKYFFSRISVFLTGRSYHDSGKYSPPRSMLNPRPGYEKSVTDESRLVFLRVLLVLHVTLTPPVQHTHSFYYDRRYVKAATKSVVK